MSIADRLFGRKQSATTRLLFSLLGVGQPVWTPRDYRRLAKEGYETNTWVYACVTGISRAAKGVPPVLYRGQGARGERAVKMIRRGNEAALRRRYGRPPVTYLNGCTPAVRRRAWAIRQAVERKELVEIETHKILNLLDNPNPEQGGEEFFEAYLSYLLIAGNSYVEGVPAGRPPVELWTLRPDRTKVIPDKQKRIGGYRYQAGGGKVDLKVEDVMHTKFFHPTEDWYGLSPLEAAARAVDRDNAAEAWNTALLQNGGRPMGALTTEGELSPEQRSDLKAALDERAGPKEAGRPLLLEGGLKWEEMGLTPRDMDWLAAQKWSLQRICGAYGYPQLLLDPEAGGSFSTDQQAARVQLYQDSVLPLLNHVYGDLNRWLVPKFGEDLLLAYDVDGIEALQEDRNEAWQRTDDVRMTLDERREAVGLDALPNGAGQVIILPTGVSVRPADDVITDPNPPPDPVDPSSDPNADPAAAKRRSRKDAGTLPSDWWSEGAEQWVLEVTGLKVTQVTDTTRAVISALISEGIKEGESMPKIAARLRATFDDFSATRSLLIARTEVIGAANAGGRFAALSTGLDLEHEWLATLDERTRPDHAEADGQRRKMHEPFDVGGHHGMFPGDPTLPPSEVCNCRCTEVYVSPSSKRSMEFDQEQKAAYWQDHDKVRAAWEAVVAARAAKRFRAEGDTLAAAVASASDGHEAMRAVELIDRDAWLGLFRSFYHGVVEDFAVRVLESLR